MGVSLALCWEELGVSLAPCWEELEVSRSRLRGIAEMPLLVVVVVAVGCATVVATAVVAVVVGGVACVTLGLLLEIYCNKRQLCVILI